MKPIIVEVAGLSLELIRGEPRSGQKGKKLQHYDVLQDGKKIGSVYQQHEHSYRKSGRLIVREWFPVRWKYRAEVVPGMSFLYYDTRKLALRRMLEDIERRPARFP